MPLGLKRGNERDEKLETLKRQIITNNKIQSVSLSSACSPLGLATSCLLGNLMRGVWGRTACKHTQLQTRGVTHNADSFGFESLICRQINYGLHLLWQVQSGSILECGSPEWPRPSFLSKADKYGCTDTSIRYTVAKSASVMIAELNLFNSKVIMTNLLINSVNR